VRLEAAHGPVRRRDVILRVHLDEAGGASAGARRPVVWSCRKFACPIRPYHAGRRRYGDACAPFDADVRLRIRGQTNAKASSR
jgi:hypothetical protein